MIMKMIWKKIDLKKTAHHHRRLGSNLGRKRGRLRFLSLRYGNVGDNLIILVLISVVCMGHRGGGGGGGGQKNSISN